MQGWRERRTRGEGYRPFRHRLGTTRSATYNPSFLKAAAHCGTRVTNHPWCLEFRLTARKHDPSSNFSPRRGCLASHLLIRNKVLYRRAVFTVSRFYVSFEIRMFCVVSRARRRWILNICHIASNLIRR